MIAGIIHTGSGVGNQLHRIVATRVLALDKGYEWGMLGKENFKCGGFMNLNLPDGVWLKEPYIFNEKKVVENGVDIRGYDPEFNFIKDNTVIDGEFQDERYFEHRLPEIREWLNVPEKYKQYDPYELVINFRGGEYVGIPDLFLTVEYWVTVIDIMLSNHPEIRFIEVETDDEQTAMKILGEARDFLKKKHPNIPDFCIMANNIERNWCKIRYARYLILSNSSFAILPALLNEDVKEVIAPKYWARRNTGVWALPQNYYKKFTYL